MDTRKGFCHLVKCHEFSHTVQKKFPTAENAVGTPRNRLTFGRYVMLHTGQAIVYHKVPEIAIPYKTHVLSTHILP